MGEWVNDKGHFHDFDVKVDRDCVTFYDVGVGEVVSVYPDPAHPLDSVAFVGASDEPLTPHRYRRGHGWAVRDVYHFTSSRECKRLRVGVTVHHGVWSSTPHEFEKHPVGGFEEAFYMVIPPMGKALVEGQGLLGINPVDTAWVVRGGDLLAVPMGYHRVCALPDDEGHPVDVAYIWGYIARYPEWEKE